MNRLANLISYFLRNESGATSIEYAVVAFGIAVVIIPAVNRLGGPTMAPFVTLKGAIRP